MKKLILLIIALTVSTHAFSDVKPCNQLKNEIAAKLEAKGVKNYTLEIVTPDQVADKQVVGSCDGGTKKIIYMKS